MNQHAWQRLLGWLAERRFTQFWVYRPENFAWLTGGDSTVVTGEGVAWLEATPAGLRLHTSVIEASRMREEEAPDLPIQTHPWHGAAPRIAPNDLEHDLTPLRLILAPEAQDRFRLLGRDAAVAAGEAMRAAHPDLTEQELAGTAAGALHARGIQPVVLLAAGEDRIRRFRHPLPKTGRLGRLAMLVICGRRGGLVANLTRMCHWGDPRAPGLYRAVLEVEADALAATQAGTTLHDVLGAIRAAYARIGRPEAFEEHHQGGLAGYRPREIVATPGDRTVVQPGMAVAWNPSLAGAKVEDTCLLTPQGLVTLTDDPAWPTVTVAGRPRPDLLSG